MKVYKKSGTKERLFEMFENVNKVKLKEGSEMWGNKVTNESPESTEDSNFKYVIIRGDDGGYSHIKIPAEKFEDHLNLLYHNFGTNSKWTDVKFNPENDYEDSTDILRNSESDVVKKHFNESFDSPIEKDEKYLDKTVGTEKSQVSKYDDGTRYPVEKELKVKDPSLEKLKGDDAPIEECDNCDDQDVADEDEPVNVGDTEPMDNAGEGEFEGDAEGLEGEVEPMDNAGEEEFEDEIEGGLADDAQPSNFDPEQIAMGIKIEMEHTDDPHKALEIAMDHLVEIPDYYTRLDAMEAEAKGEGGENMEDEMDSPEDALLDPSKHWVDDYSPSNVTDEGINYPTPFTDPEAGEDEYEEEQKFNAGEFEADVDNNDDEMHGINKIDLDAEEDEDWNKRIRSGQMKPTN